MRLLLRKLGFGVWKLDSPEFLNFENVLWQVLRRYGRITYLQIGANDGVFADPLFDFIRRHNTEIRGVALEPVPHLYDRLCHNLKSFESIRPIQRAIHSHKQTMKMYCLRPELESSVDVHLKGMASFDKEHLLRHPDVSSSDLLEITVRCSSLSEVISDFDLRDLNVLIMDTEGYDAEILRAVDFNTIRPMVIRFEHGVRNGIMQSAELADIIAQLNLHGYQVIVEENDATAVSTDALRLVDDSSAL